MGSQPGGMRTSLRSSNDRLVYLRLAGDALPEMKMLSTKVGLADFHSLKGGVDNADTEFG